MTSEVHPTNNKSNETNKMPDTNDPDYVDDDTDDEDLVDDGEFWKEDLEILVSKKAKPSKEKKTSNKLRVSTFPKSSQTNLDNQARSLHLSASASTFCIDALFIKKVEISDVYDCNLLSEKEKKGLAKVWSENLCEGRGIRPLDEFEGKDEKQRKQNRVVSHYETGCKGVAGNEKGHPLNVILTYCTIPVMWGVRCFEVVEEGVLCKLCNIVLNNTSAYLLARHAACCKPENNMSECKYCGENDIPNEYKNSHITNCKCRFETLLTKLDQLAIIHSLNPTSKQAMLDGDSSKWIMRSIDKDYTLEEMKAMNNEQNHPLGESDSAEAIKTMNELRKSKVRRSILKSIQVALGLQKSNLKSKKYGGLIKAALNDFGFVSLKYPTNQR